ncbi:hypothetical protein P20652_3437 [Pseudoalteromonas sp. BSi20652]|nr:hypothetical protein P20652_3437 [Pseudoalteromonas sp. BSi20652]
MQIIGLFFAFNLKKRKIRAPYAPDLRFGKCQLWQLKAK